VFFPQLLLRTFFSHELAPHQTSLLIYSCYGLWFFFLCEGLAWIGYSVLNALKDLKFYMFYTLISAFFFNYLPMHLAFVKGDWTPEKIWWLMSIPCLAAATAYVIRISSKLKIESKLENEPN
jgi:Na+-driven multidrug efflux pump